MKLLIQKQLDEQDSDEYDEEDMNASTGLVNADGSHPKFFSNARPRVVLKHFEWMVRIFLHRNSYLFDRSYLILPFISHIIITQRKRMAYME